MPDRVRLAPALVLVLLLAGCAGRAPQDDAPRGGRSPAAETWTWAERAPAPVILAETAVAAEDGVFTIVGGWTQAGGGSPVVVEYDAAADAWSQRAPYPLAVHHAQAARVDGVVYAFGGALTTVPLPGSVVGVGPGGWPRTPLAFKLAPGATAWEPIASLPEARALGAAAALDGRIYLVGGLGLEGYLGAVHVYDPSTDSYSEAAPLPTLRDHLSLVAHAGRLHALAGRSNAGGAWDDLEAHEAYDPALDAWTPLAPAPLGRGGQGAGVAAGRIVLVGGERAEGEFTIYDDAHAYDAASDAWHPLPPLPEPLHGMAAASHEGRLFVMGGAGASGISMATLELAAS